MFVTALRLSVLRFLRWPVMIFSPGRDYDYQTLNLTFAINVMKFGLIIGLFPKPLKPCVVSPIRLALSLNLLKYRFTHVIEPSLPDSTTN